MQYGHRKIRQDQDEHIEQIHAMAVRMKHAGYEINSELQRQNRIIGQLDMQIDETTGRLEGLHAQLGQLLQTKDINQVCTCMMLAVMMVVLIFLVIYF